MINQNIEFLYNNIEIHITKQFGWAYNFKYAGNEYYSNGNYINLENCKIDAKSHVDRICNRSNYRDEMETNV